LFVTFWTGSAIMLMATLLAFYYGHVGATDLHG